MSDKVKIYFERDGQKLEADVSPEPRKVLLDILDDLKWNFPYGCRAGSCGSCRVEIVKGLEEFVPAGPMEEDTLERCRDTAMVRLACRAQFKPQAPSTLREVRIRIAPSLPDFDDEEAEEN